MKRSLHSPQPSHLQSGAAGAAGNAMVGFAAAGASGSRDDRLRNAVRATGNGTFVAFASPFVLPRLADRHGWWTYVGAHAAHISHLVRMARHGGSFSATSRYGGAAAYATLVALGATGYSPGGAPCQGPAIRELHHAGERFLFGLYGFTIAHGFLAKGRRPVYAPLAVLWLLAAARGRARWAG